MKLIVANFKMNLLEKDIDNYLEKINTLNKNVVFCPSEVYLKQFIDHNYVVGIQNIGFNAFGAYTGDTSIEQAKELGVNYAIVGHSERRQYYNDNQYVNKKVKLCLEHKVTPIVCIGENKDTKDKSLTINFLKKQLDDIFVDNLVKDDLIIAYEPIWSIGTGDIPTNEYIYNVINTIKTYVKDAYKLNVKVLYGGSVSEKNIADLENIAIVDGYLVGGCSIDAIRFNKLIESI